MEFELTKRSVALGFARATPRSLWEACFPLTCSLGLKLLLSWGYFSPQGTLAMSGDILDGHDGRDVTGIWRTEMLLNILQCRG